MCVFINRQITVIHWTFIWFAIAVHVFKDVHKSRFSYLLLANMLYFWTLSTNNDQSALVLENIDSRGWLMSIAEMGFYSTYTKEFKG